jgi:hypothetical protein
MGEHKENVSIMFIAEFRQVDRLRYFIRKIIPHKVYFVEHSVIKEGVAVQDKLRNEMDEVKAELKKDLPPWVYKGAIDAKMDIFSFEDTFPKLLKIMTTEMRAGNDVHLLLHGGSVVTSAAGIMAASLTGTKLYWVKPKDWKSVGKQFGDERIMIPQGASHMINLKFPLKPALPEGPESHLLVHIAQNKGKIAGKLIDLAGDIGLDKIGANVKKPTSGAVKLSKFFTKLKQEGLIETRRTGRKSLEIELTEHGKLIAEVLQAME